MRELAQLLGLAVGDLQEPIRDIPAEISHLVTDDMLDLELYVGDHVIHTREVTHDWSDVVLLNGTAIVSVGVDGFTGQMRDLDRYLQRRARIYLGRMTVLFPD